MVHGVSRMDAGQRVTRPGAIDLQHIRAGRRSPGSAHLLPLEPAGPEGRDMRTVAIGILALMCGGCAAPAFDLVSHDPESPWLPGQRWVRTESSRATVSASFDRYWLDHLVFDVE